MIAMTRFNNNNANIHTKPWRHYHVTDNLTEARDVLDEMLAQAFGWGWDDAACFRLRLAGEEAAVNAFKHGNRDCPERCVAIGYNVASDRISMMFEDEGEGFDLHSVPDPTDDANVFAPSGRGVFLIRNFMTAVEYNRKGNRVTMTLDRYAE